jgi:hypothetical protein
MNGESKKGINMLVIIMVTTTKTTLKKRVLYTLLVQSTCPRFDRNLPFIAFDSNNISKSARIYFLLTVSVHHCCSS